VRTSRAIRLYEESTRSGIAFAGAVAATVPVLALGAEPSGQAAFDWAVGRSTIVFAVYQLLYVVVTLALFLHATPPVFAAVVAAPGRATWLRRWVTLTEPGSGLAVSVGAAALVTAVWTLPRAERFAVDLPTWAVQASSVGLIVGAWAGMIVTYALDYARKQHLAGGLEFPGEQPDRFADYLYLSVSTSTAFTPSDVQVTTRAMRRTVAAHGVVAFVFNTIVLALTIAVVAAT